MSNADDRMLADHQRMWHDFCRIMKYALVAVVLIVGLVLYLNAR